MRRNRGGRRGRERFGSMDASTRQMGGRGVRKAMLALAREQRGTFFARRRERERPTTERGVEDKGGRRISDQARDAPGGRRALSIAYTSRTSGPVARRRSRGKKKKKKVGAGGVGGGGLCGRRIKREESKSRENERRETRRFRRIPAAKKKFGTGSSSSAALGNSSAHARHGPAGRRAQAKAKSLTQSEERSQPNRTGRPTYGSPTKVGLRRDKASGRAGRRRVKKGDDCQGRPRNMGLP